MKNDDNLWDFGSIFTIFKNFTVPILGSKVVDRYPNFYSNKLISMLKLNGDTGTTLMKTESDGELFFFLYFLSWLGV